MKLLRTDNMEMLYNFVTPYIEFDDKPFVLRSKFPNRAFTEDEEGTMASLGLAPNYAL